MTRLEFISSLTDSIEILVKEGVSSFGVYSIRHEIDRLCEEFLDFHGEYDCCSIYDRKRQAEREAREVQERQGFKKPKQTKQTKESKKYYPNLQSLLDAGYLVMDENEAQGNGI